MEVELIDLREEEPYFGNVKVLVDAEDMTEAQRADAGLRNGVIMRVEAEVGFAGKVTTNTRLYRVPLMEREITGKQEDVKSLGVYMLAGHPKKDEAPDPMRIVGLITGLSMTEDGTETAVIEAGGTDAGKNFAAIARMGAKVGFSKRGRGKADKVKFTDQHPNYVGNETWVGRTIEDISEIYELETYDWVVKAAQRETGISAIKESEETTMDFKLETLTDENWNLIEGSDRVKNLITEAVKAVTDEKVEAVMDTQEFGERMAKNDAFVSKVLDLYDAEGDDEPEKKTECTTCKKEIVEGATFCNVCGARQVLTEGAEPDQPADEKDKALKAVEESNKRLREQMDELVESKKATDEKTAKDKIITEALQDKPQNVIDSVKTALSKREFTAEKAPEIVKDEITFFEGILPKEDPAGKGQTQVNEDGSPAEGGEPPKEGELNEQEAEFLDAFDD